MKALFIYSLEDVHSIDKPLKNWSQIQFGISYISSLLKKHGHQAKLIVLKSNYPKESLQLLKTAVESGDPDIICFSAVFSQYDFIADAARFIQDNYPKIFRVIGGAHATLNPDDVITGPFDAMCLGEGEYPLLELCQCLGEKRPFNEIENFWFKDSKGNIKKNPVRNFIEDIDGLPLADREIWAPWIKNLTHGQISILLGRGCPHECSYCSNHGLKKVANGKYVRFRSPEKIIEELRQIHGQHPHKHVHFELESIAISPKWMHDFCRKLEEFNQEVDHQIFYSGNYRIRKGVNLKEIFIALKRANFYKIHIGLESGSEKIRREVLNRSYSNEEFLETVEAARAAGLKIYVFNLIGIPQESFADHLETVRLNRQCQPDGHYTSIVCPYPGTKLYNLSVEKGFIDKGSYNAKHERLSTALHLPDFSKKKIQAAYVWFDYHVYRGHRSLIGLYKNLIHTKVRSTPILNTIYNSFLRIPIVREMRNR